MNELPPRRFAQPLAERWQYFRHACLPPDAPEEMVDACRAAYVAGIGELFRYMFEVSYQPEENWDQWIARIHEEVVALVLNETRLAAGKATDG